MDAVSMVIIVRVFELVQRERTVPSDFRDESSQKFFGALRYTEFGMIGLKVLE